MNLTPLTALGPLDGRYRNKVSALSDYFSEFALIRYRVLVEVEYLIALFETGLSPMEPLSAALCARLRSVYQDFNESDAQQVKAFESKTNHDVKAVEYFIKERIDALGDQKLLAQKEFVHFGLTSQDINNTATPLMLRDAIKEVFLPGLEGIIGSINQYARDWRGLAMLSRTHGQPASPTTLGKEFAVFAERLQVQTDILRELPYPGKFGGASGNLNAHYIAYPEHDWGLFAKNLVEERLGLQRAYPTTQIEHYDGLARIFDCLKRINTIVIDLCQDVWLYVSQEYFKQKVKAGEVGSSAMPHKVNPIDFENAEGNSGLSSAVLEFLSRKLPVSRLQRDLTDSTILRNLGVALGYALLAQNSLAKGLGKLEVNPQALKQDLSSNWAVLAEAIQTILRREAYPNPYEALRDFTRGKSGINEESLKAFVDGLDVPEKIKAELKALRPESYIGDSGPNGV